MKEVVLQLYVAFFVRDREDPLHMPMAFTIDESVTKISQIMTYAYQEIKVKMLEMRWLTLVDDTHSHHMIWVDDIIAVRILAPDLESLKTVPWIEIDSWDDEEGENG